MRPFLVCYNYGQGGIWSYIQAPDASEITASYRDLAVFETPPSSWRDELEQIARSHNPGESPFWAEWLKKLKR